MHQRKIPAVMIALAFALIANADEPASAPWSPDFIRYLDWQKQAVLAPDAVDTVENYGLIPLPTEIPQAPVPEGTEQRKTFAARYDLREKEKCHLSAIKAMKAPAGPLLPTAQWNPARYRRKHGIFLKTTWSTLPALIGASATAATSAWPPLIWYAGTARCARATINIRVQGRV